MAPPPKKALVLCLKGRPLAEHQKRTPFSAQLTRCRSTLVREWTTREQQQLVELIDDVPVEQVARVLRRPPASVRSMLHRLGLVAFELLSKIGQA